MHYKSIPYTNHIIYSEFASSSSLVKLLFRMLNYELWCIVVELRVLDIVVRL